MCGLNNSNKLPLGTITPLDRSPFLPIRLFHQTFYFPVNPTPQATKLQANHLRILQVGKLSQPLKRHDWTIRILRELNQPCTLTICGADLDLDYDDGTRSITYYSELMDTPGQTELNGNLSITIFSNLKHKTSCRSFMLNPTSLYCHPSMRNLASPFLKLCRPVAAL